MSKDRLIAGRYRLTDPIGTGAMGVVWRALDIRLQRTVAVKQVLLGPNLTEQQTAEARKRALREGRIAARLHHPNAISVFDVADEDGQPWLVMEYMNAPSLANRLNLDGTLAPLKVAELGAQAAAALAAAHDAGIVHRDVKPANLLVGDDGTVKITDFGISRATGDVTVTATGFLAGTPAYLAPEVARGEQPIPSSDVFALGSTLYHAITGRPPFGDGDNPLAVLHAVAGGQVEPPEGAGALGPVVMRLLATEVANRPTMDEARVMLEEVAAGRAPEPVGTAPSATTKVIPPTLAATATLDRPDPEPAPADTRPPAAAPAFRDAGVPAVAGSAPAPAAAVPTGPAGERRSGTRSRTAVLAGAAALLLVVVVGLVLADITGGDDNTAAGPESSQVEVPEQTGEPQAEPSDPSTTAASTTTTETGPPSAARVEQFVRGYYGLLPGNTAAAWSQLAPEYQAVAGGYADYQGFWSTISAVSIGSVSRSGDGSAVATVTYTMRDGSVQSESRSFRVAPNGGQLVITDSQVL
ncbi:serine/threonine-protein kinase [Nocardia flavorosea]|uniref:non-specific serine/threonine protein kinase n=1 Tax=Nocardia flavorosea TaxID=53429 RepID=A0A846YGH2_9NOCA|nr:serine/threonine-protein kinase [Nocardia flavorosea]NKY58067.1 serine/threonine protein kinase [Nocardia flavorosea]